MKKTTTLLFSLAITALYGQGFQNTSGGGEVLMPVQSAPCLNDAQRQQIKAELHLAQQDLILRGILPSLNDSRGTLPHPLFQWPVAKNPSAPYNQVWGISNYVDHNLSYPNQVQDYNCGTRTYDSSSGYNHAGIDIYTFPFQWYQMDNNQSWAVAAAPGVIIAKGSVQNDRSCQLNNNVWNAVYVRHDDGSVAWYGHLKKNSLTTKAVGESVIVGEFLGVIGSSGNSTGPHLHFEVYDRFDDLVDPYAGTCNNWESSTNTWWASQKPYLNTKVNAFLTHNALPEFSACPQTEIPNLKTNFLFGETVYMAVYLTDQLAGSSATVKMIRPNNTVQFNFTQNLAAYYYNSYWYWTLPPSDLTQTGTYQISYTYQGNTVSNYFTYGILGVDENTISSIDFYPNPASDKIIFSQPFKTLEIYNVDGKKLTVPHTLEEADISSLPNGIFIIRGVDENGISFSKKLVK